MSFLSSLYTLIITPLELLFEVIFTIANKVIGAEFLCCGTHEQYFYPDYFNYQPDFPEKIMNVGKVLHEAGYEFMFSQDL